MQSHIYFTQLWVLTFTKLIFCDFYEIHVQGHKTQRVKKKIWTNYHSYRSIAIASTWAIECETNYNNLKHYKMGVMVHFNDQCSDILKIKIMNSVYQTQILSEYGRCWKQNVIRNIIKYEFMSWKINNPTMV